MIEQLAKHIKAIGQEIRRLIDSDPTFKQTLVLLLSVPGIGLPLAAHLLIAMQETLDPKVLAALIGICPIKHESGTSVFAAPTSRHYGPQFRENCSTLPLVRYERTKSNFNNISFVKSRKASTGNSS